MSTYVLLSSNTLGSAAASVTFNSIPQTFTDLLLICSTRSSSGSQRIRLQFNGDTTNKYATLYCESPGGLLSNGSSNGPIASTQSGVLATSTSDANGFGSTEIYLANYASSVSKAIGAFANRENNSSSTDTILAFYGSLWNTTSAISSILIFPDANNFVATSSFYLYGIKNS